MAFSTPIKVRFGDADLAGLVYYPVIFHYLHIAMEEFLTECGGKSYTRLLSEERIGFPTVKVEAEFLAPLVYGDEADVEVSVEKIGQSSVTLAYAVKRAGDGVVCARARLVHVAMDLERRRPAPIPERYRRAFEEQGS